MLCRDSQDGQIMVESSDKMWSTGEGNGKPPHSCLENPMNSTRQKDQTLKDELAGVPSGCEGKLGVALESLQGRRDLT